MGSLAANGTHVLGRADRDRSGYLGCGFRGMTPLRRPALVVGVV